MPKHRTPDAPGKQARRSAALHSFVQATGRKAQKGREPNDRSVERRETLAIRRMPPLEFDRLLRDGEEP